MNSDARTDLERSFYFFIKATNNVLSSKNDLPPHVLFALDNVIRRVVENLVSLIRPDFIPAANNALPMTPNDNGSTSPMVSRSSLFPGSDSMKTDEVTRLHQQYSNLASTSRQRLLELIRAENENSMKLLELIESNRTNQTETTKNLLGKLDISQQQSSEIEDPNSENAPLTDQSQHPTVNHTGPFKVLMNSRQLVDLEVEHNALLKSIIDNRNKFKQLLQSSKDG